MKNFIKIFFTALLIAGLNGCDGKLDEPFENVDPTTDTDYTEPAQMRLLLLGAYDILYDLQWEAHPLIAVRGDDVNPAGDQEPLIQTDQFNYNREFWMYNSDWLNFYTDIIYFHGTMEELEKFKPNVPNPVIADQYQAEVKVMIGWEMLQLARLWGGLIIPQSSQTTEIFDLPVSSPQEVYQYISDLMDEAIPLLPTVGPNARNDVPGGVTVYTAQAVKALANLELKNYQAVADATGQIINSGVFMLFDDYYELFKTPGKLADENILEFQYSDFNQGTGEQERFRNAEFYGPASWTPAREGAANGWGFWEPSLKYVKFMLDRGEEVRLETSVIFTNRGIAELQTDPNYATLPDWISNTTRDGDVFNDNVRTMFSSGKHYLPSNQLIQGRTSYASNKNFIVIRYSEVLLMYAEALTSGASGGSLTADDAVNLVRERAGLDPITGVTIEDVLDEKYAEFAMEWGIRFYDVVRHDMTNELNRDGRTYNSGEDQYLPYPLAQQDLLPQLREAANGGS